MRQHALFINGVYESVFKEILKTQAELPEQILFLQPFGGKRIVALQESPPATDDPMRLFLSIKTDLGTVHYTAEIVGWDDKTLLGGARGQVIERVLNVLQPGEHGLKNSHPAAGGVSRNLIHIWHLRREPKPFPVQRLLKVADRKPLRPRKVAGGWAYVWRELAAEPLPTRRS